VHRAGVVAEVKSHRFSAAAAGLSGSRPRRCIHSPLSQQRFARLRDLLARQKPRPTPCRATSAEPDFANRPRQRFAGIFEPGRPRSKVWPRPWGARAAGGDLLFFGLAEVQLEAGLSGCAVGIRRGQSRQQEVGFGGHNRHCSPARLGETEETHASQDCLMPAAEKMAIAG